MPSSIKLLICYHKKAPLFKDNILTPIHVGRSNAEKRLDHNSDNYKWLINNMIGDNTGENISKFNDSYNEMTALYWAWKNYDKLGNPDYIGLMHYRRHFVLREGEQCVYNIQNFEQDTYYDIINYSEDNLQKIIEGCDFVTHIGHVQNVYRHFIENQRKADIDLANKIVLEKYPEYESVMKEYYSGDDSNFCNMNIFSRNIFFQYCEWIFDILGEFEKRVDISEKRFFISERLTGIFIAKLMKKESLKYKTLPISFIDEPVKVPVVLRLDKENMLSTAMAIVSIMENATGYHFFHFYLFISEDFGEVEKRKFEIFSKRYEKCSIKFIVSNVSEDVLPIYISDVLPKINKCIYISGNVLALFDIGEFYRICSVDDYFVIGVPKGEYCPKENIKSVSNELMVLNCNRIRSHKVARIAHLLLKKGETGTDLINELCKEEIGYIPWYFFTSERLEHINSQLFNLEKTRGKIQEETLWRPFLIYDMERPIENNQGVYGIFWWNMFQKLPLYFQKVDINLTVLGSLYQMQQKEINGLREQCKNSISYKEENLLSVIDEQLQEKEDWRKYGLWGKLKFYYKYNGLRKTIKFLGEKVFGKRG